MFQLTLVTSQLGHCHSFTWFTPKIPPQPQTGADPCCPYHLHVAPLHTEPQFPNFLPVHLCILVKMLLLTFKPPDNLPNRNGEINTAFSRLPRYSGQTRGCANVTVFNVLILTVLSELGWPALQQDAKSKFA